MSFYVIKPGFLTSVQDYGRFNHSQYAMSQCGALDEYAYCWANYLLDNDFNDAVIEISFGGIQLRAQADTLIATTGADLDFKINNKPKPTWNTIQIVKGDILSFIKPKSGVRSYLAVSGGFKSETFFGSKSVNLREHIGAKLNKNTILPYLPVKKPIHFAGKTSISAKFYNKKMASILLGQKYHSNDNQAIILRLLPSYQFNNFDIKSRDLFFNQNYNISNACDRAGMRLNGVPIKTHQNRMISEGISYGSVEITADGLPIILLKDAPTIGGYPKIGTVFSLDLPHLAQAQPNTQVRFKPMEINQAQQQRAKFNRFFKITNF